MTDLLSIGSSGINVYQRALSTVSNNIANLNTEGYSRQTTEIRQNQPVEVGKGFVGTGAYFDRVARQYDSFLESALQQATSDLEAQGAAVEFTNRLLDVLGDENVGLTTALNRFFSSAKALSADPASPALRGIMLRESEALATRFNGLSGQLNDLQDQSLSAMEADIRSVNALAQQIAEVNRQMLKKSSSLDQPSELLDRRDQLLRDLSEYVQIRTQFDRRGSVTVALSESTTKGLLISGTKSSEISATPSASNPQQLDLRLQGELSNESLTQIPSGSIAGFARFYEETLVNVTRSLDQLARVLVDEVNTIQTTGLNGTGELGGSYFEIRPTFNVDKGASFGDFEVDVLVRDPATYVPETLAVAYDGTQARWFATNDDGSRVFANPQGVLNLEQVSVQISGQPQVGDQFTITPDASAARGIQLAIQDGIEIAAAALFRATPASTNNGIFDPKVTFNEPAPLADANLTLVELQGYRSQSVSPSQIRPVTVVPAGQQEISFILDPNAGSNNALQILTADGQHIVGSSTIGSPNTLSQTAAQFEENSTYGDNYLNRSGLSGYKDWELFYGVESVATEVTQVLPATGFIFEAPFGSDFAGGGLDITVSPATEDDRLRLLNSPFADPTLGVVSVTDNALFVGSGDRATRIGVVEPVYNGDAQTLRIRFEQDLPEGLINDDLASRVAALVTFSSGSDFRNGPHPETRQITAQVFSANRTTAVQRDRIFSSTDLVDAGLIVDPSTAYQAVLKTTDLEYAAGVGRVLIDAGDVSLNGVDLGELAIDATGIVSANTIKDWLDSAGTAVEVVARNQIEIASSRLKLADGAGLMINNVPVSSIATEAPTRFDDATDLVASINAKTTETGVFARVAANGNMVLENTDLGGANIVIAGDVSGTGNNVLGIASKTYLGQVSMQLESARGDPIRLELGEAGRPADLNLLGLNTEVRLTGSLDEELLVFMTGGGSADLSATQRSSDILFANGLRARRFEVEFVANDRYRIKDLTTDTVVADRAYSGEAVLSYQGMQIQLDRAPAVGDAFIIDGNNLGPGGSFDAQGNNSNILRFVDLESEGVLNGGLTLSEGYLRFVGDVGNMATQSQIARDALQIVQTQAVEARDRVSGVNLDKEAADLIRFQQAYQASAQVMQVATRLFDAILQVR